MVCLVVLVVEVGLKHLLAALLEMEEQVFLDKVILEAVVQDLIMDPIMKLVVAAVVVQEPQAALELLHQQWVEAVVLV